MAPIADKENVAQEIVDDLLTDPDADASTKPAPLPPQTVDAEPTGGRPGQHRVPDGDEED